MSSYLVCPQGVVQFRFELTIDRNASCVTASTAQMQFLSKSIIPSSALSLLRPIVHPGESCKINLLEQPEKLVPVIVRMNFYVTAIHHTQIHPSTDQFRKTLKLAMGEFIGDRANDRIMRVFQPDLLLSKAQLLPLTSTTERLRPNHPTNPPGSDFG